MRVTCELLYMWTLCASASLSLILYIPSLLTKLKKEDFLREIPRNTIGELVIVSLQSTTQIS